MSLSISRHTITAILPICSPWPYPRLPLLPLVLPRPRPLPALRALALRLRQPLLHTGGLCALAAAGVPLPAAFTAGDRVLLVLETLVLSGAVGSLIGGGVAWLLTRRREET